MGALIISTLAGILTCKATPNGGAGPHVYPQTAVDLLLAYITSI
jgi:hypothetical protein